MSVSGKVFLAGQAKGDCRALAGSSIHLEAAAQAISTGLHIGQTMAYAPRIVEGIKSLPDVFRRPFLLRAYTLRPVVL
ncbi:MAG: hypothetical protein P8Y37_13125 [Anaerolineales bacterium]